MKRYNARRRFLFVSVASVLVFSAVLCSFFFQSRPLTIYAQDIQPTPIPGTYIPDEYIVRYADDNSPADIQALADIRSERSDSPIGALQNIQQNLVFSMTGQDTPEETIARIQEVQNETGVVATQDPFEDKSVFLYKTDGSKNTAQTLSELQNIPAVEYAEPNYIFYALTIPNDTDYAKQWGMKNIKMEDAWGKTTGSSSVTVAVVDSGVEVNHPDLQGNVVKSESHNVARCRVGEDNFGHGSHVAGIIGAVGNNGSGVTGVNWGVKINGYCVLDEEYGDAVSIVSGIRAAIQDNVDVINLSIGGPGNSTEVHRIIQEAVSKGIVVVAAAGNCGRSSGTTQCPYGGDVTKYYPASYSEVITVAACGPNNERASYSNTGSAVDICAPGGAPVTDSNSCKSDATDCIRSTWVSNGYRNIAGTSQASPHVAGAAALLLAVNANLSPSQIQAVLEATAEDLGTAGKDTNYGAGLLDVKAAVDAVKSGNIPTAVPQPTTQPTTQPTSQITQPQTSVTQPQTTTVQPTGSTGTPPPESMNHPCYGEAQRGNYDCNQVTDDNDRIAFEADFKQGKANLQFWEWIRKALFPNS